MSTDIPMNEDDINDLLGELDAELAATGVTDTPTIEANAPVAEADEIDPALLDGIDLPDEQPAPVTAPDPKPQPDERVKVSKKLKSVPKAEAPEPEPAASPAEAPSFASAGEASYKIGDLDFYVDVNAFKAETVVTEVNLDQCLIEQSGLRAYYGVQAAKAEAQAARAKTKFEVIEAKLYQHHRELLLAAGEKVTEKAVEAEVKLDPKWLEEKNRVIEAETISNINRALVQSLADRRDMIIQLGADRREEGKGAPRIMERAAAVGRSSISPRNQ